MNKQCHCVSVVHVVYDICPPFWLIIDFIAINYDCQKQLALICIQLILNINRTKYDLFGQGYMNIVQVQ